MHKFDECHKDFEGFSAYYNAKVRPALDAKFKQPVQRIEKSLSLEFIAIVLVVFYGGLSFLTGVTFAGAAAVVTSVSIFFVRRSIIKARSKSLPINSGGLEDWLSEHVAAFASLDYIAFPKRTLFTWKGLGLTEGMAVKLS